MGYKYLMTSEAIKFILTALGGATAGAMIAGAFALLNAWRTSVRETAKWHREQKMDAYVEFLKDIQDFIQVFSRFHDQGPVSLPEAKELGAAIRNEKLLIIASTEVRQAQRELGVAVNAARNYLDKFDRTATERDPVISQMSQHMGTTRDAFLMAIQKDLKLPVGEPVFPQAATVAVE